MRFYFHNQKLADGWPGDTHCRLVVGMEGLVLPLFRIRLPFRLLTVHRTNPSAPVTSRSALRPNAAPGSSTSPVQPFSTRAKGGSCE
jgi:hypothetical protein